MARNNRTMLIVKITSYNPTFKIQNPKLKLHQQA